MIAFETSVRIDAPLEDVFAYVSDPRTFPSWNSAVAEVQPRRRSRAHAWPGRLVGASSAALPQLARRAVKRGVDHNLATLKVILEGGAR